MTSFYMFRLIYLTFFGKPRMGHEVEHHIHESPKIDDGAADHSGDLLDRRRLARMPHASADRIASRSSWSRSLRTEAVRAGAAKAQAGDKLAAGEQQGSTTDPLEYVLMGASVGAACARLVVAQRAYSKADKGYKEPIRGGAAALSDAVPQVLCGRNLRLPVHRAQARSAPCDWARWDWAKRCGSSTPTSSTAGQRRRLDDAHDRHLSSCGTSGSSTASCVNGVAIVTRRVSYPVRLLQWGLVQWYALVMVAGLVVSFVLRREVMTKEAFSAVQLALIRSGLSSIGHRAFDGVKRTLRSG